MGDVKQGSFHIVHPHCLPPPPSDGPLGETEGRGCLVQPLTAAPLALTPGNPR